MSRDYEQLLLDRRRAEKPVEATISEAVHSCGLRRSRYRKRRRRAFHAMMATAALNVRRLLRCLGREDGPKQAAAACFLGLITALLWRLQRRTGAILASILGCLGNRLNLAHSPA